MSPLLWMAFLTLAAMVAFLILVFIAWLGETKPVKRINARIAAEYEANPLGGARMWDGESHLLPPWKVRS